MNTALAAQILRGFRGSLRTAGVSLNWPCEPLTAGITFDAIVNASTPAADRTDRTRGDDTPVEITAAVEDFAAGEGKLPEQGDSFTSAAGVSYRVAAIPPRDPSHPLIRFTIENAVILPLHT